MIQSKRDRHSFAHGWMEEIKTAKRYRKRYSRSSRWDDYRKYYRGDWKGDIIPVNRVFSLGRSLVPHIYFQNPRVCVTAKRPDLVLHARVVEAVDNHLIQETMLKKTLKSSVLTSFLTGTGPIKLGYDSEFGYAPEQAVDVDSGTVTQHARSERRKIEYQVSVKPGMPWALPEQPENVIVPPGYKDVTTLPWIAHRILRPLDDVKQDQKYKNTKDLTGTRRMQLTDDMQQLPLFFEEDREHFAELWEIRDAKTGMIHVLCENEILLSMPDVLQVEGLPWEFLIYNEDPEYFWGISDVSQIEPQQLEYNEIRTQSRAHRAIALVKFLFKKGAMTKPMMEHFLSGEVGPGIEIDDESIASAISILQPHIPPDLQSEGFRVLDDMKETLGFNENSLASFARGTPPTASETMQVGQAYDRRVAERRDITADVMTQIIRKWNQYIFSFWTGERVVQIAGPNGAQQWVQYSGDQLRGEYSLRIDAESGIPINRQTRLEAAATLLKAFGGDQMISQGTIKSKFLEQFEYIFPGISQAMAMMPPDMENLTSVSRQPHPMMGGSAGSPRGSNRGGGRQGSSPDKPIEFEQMKKRFMEGGGR